MNKAMNDLRWLVKREMWEHKGAIVWTPLALAGIMAATFCGSLIMGLNHSRARIDGVDISNLTSQNPEAVERGMEVLAQSYPLTGIPIFLALGFVMFFYLLGTLYDERKDRSVLFWKSLPISDEKTVLSKAITALVIAPGVALLASLGLGVVALFGVVVGASAAGINLWPVFTKPEFYLAPLQALMMVALYVAWALPTAGWLMLVSAWAKGKPFLWAVLVPLGVAMATTILNVDPLQDFLITAAQRVTLGTMPVMWLSEAKELDVGNAYPLSGLSGVALSRFASPSLWVGVLAGVGMMIGAAKVRRWKDEG